MRGLVWILWLFYLGQAWCSLSSTSVTAIAGEESALPCNITPPRSDDEVALVLWYKDDSTTPIYSLDTRRAAAVREAKHVAADSLASRAYLSTVQEPALLKLSPVQKDDEGDYKCRADFKNARTRYSSVQLRVIVPPRKPVIADETGEILESLIGPYNEGDRLRLICETEGGDPLPTLTWWRESVLLDESWQHTSQGISRNELEIPVLQRHDLMAVFSCRATNNNVSAPAVAAVTVDLNFRPLDVRIETDRVPLSAQKPAELLCRSSGSRPPALITWWKGKNKLKPAKDRVSVDGNSTTSGLHFVPTSDDHGAVILCRAENLLIPGSHVEDDMQLDIQYVPQVSLRLGNKLRHTHIQEGNDVYFECTVKANPWISHINWVFEGQEIHTNTSAGIILSNHSLVLQNVQRTQRGKYQCKSDNVEGEGTSNAVTLRVQYAPVCKAGQRHRYGAAPRETLEVPCEVEGDPTSVTFHWLFNNSAHSMETVSYTSEGTRSTAVFTVLNEDYYGTLLCWASNTVGTQVSPCTFAVFQAGPPDPLSNCSVFNQSESGFCVECRRTFGPGTMGGSLPQSFLMEVYDSQLQRLRLNESSMSPSFVTRDLPSGTSFVVVLFAINAKGRSEALVVPATTLASPESLVKTSGVWQLNFSPVLLALVAVVVALVAIACIFVIAIKIKQRYRQEKDMKIIKKEHNTDILLRKDNDEFCNNGSYGLDERCPDIISDFNSRDDFIRTNTSFCCERKIPKILKSMNSVEKLEEISNQDVLEPLQV